MRLTGDQVVALVDGLPPVLAAIAALVAALRARRDAREAKTVAASAHEKAVEAQREQINFARRRDAALAAEQKGGGAAHGN